MLFWIITRISVGLIHLVCLLGACAEFISVSFQCLVYQRKFRIYNSFLKIILWFQYDNRFTKGGKYVYTTCQRKGGINFNHGYFLPTYEVIYLIAKPQFKLAPKANSYGDVWEFKQEMKNPHPAPFPVALIDRIISSTTAKIILDPFMGSGTTAIAAMGNDRDFIGIDISPEYCEMAEKRIEKNKIISEVKLMKSQLKIF